MMGRAWAWVLARPPLGGVSPEDVYIVKWGGLRMLLSEALTEFDLSLVGNAVDSTRRWYAQRLLSLVEYLGDVEVCEVTVSDLRHWRAWLVERTTRWADHPSRPEVEGGLSVWTIRGYVRACRRLFKWLVDEGTVDSSPAARLKLPPKPKLPPRAVDPGDVLAMIEVADVRDRAIVSFLAATGCRVGGLCDLRLRDLDLGRNPPRAEVREKGRGGKKTRVVFFGHATLVALRAWLRMRPESEDDHVFVGQRGRLSESGVYQVLKRLAKRAGVEGRFNPHAFRHGFARGALRNGADLGTVSQLLGHSDVGVTVEHYAQWAVDELGERHSQYSWFGKVRDEDSAEDF
jgi:site-specific recombinase XerD